MPRDSDLNSCFQALWDVVNSQTEVIEKLRRDNKKQEKLLSEMYSQVTGRLTALESAKERTNEALQKAINDWKERNLELTTHKEQLRAQLAEEEKTRLEGLGKRFAHQLLEQNNPASASRSSEPTAICTSLSTSSKAAEDPVTVAGASKRPVSSIRPHPETVTSAGPSRRPLSSVQPCQESDSVPGPSRLGQNTSSPRIASGRPSRLVKQRKRNYNETESYFNIDPDVFGVDLPNKKKKKRR